MAPLEGDIQVKQPAGRGAGRLTWTVGRARGLAPRRMVGALVAARTRDIWLGDGVLVSPGWALISAPIQGWFRRRMNQGTRPAMHAPRMAARATRPASWAVVRDRPLAGNAASAPVVPVVLTHLGVMRGELVPAFPLAPVPAWLVPVPVEPVP